MTKSHPRQLAIDLSARSVCRVQVAAVVSDAHGILSWGWNNPGEDGLGQHAEAHAIQRANRKRLRGATITVAGFRRRNKKAVQNLPCEACAAMIQRAGIARVEYLDKDRWQTA